MSTLRASRNLPVQARPGGIGPSAARATRTASLCRSPVSSSQNPGHIFNLDYSAIMPFMFQCHHSGDLRGCILDQPVPSCSPCDGAPESLTPHCSRCTLAKRRASAAAARQRWESLCNFAYESKPRGRVRKRKRGRVGLRRLQKRHSPAASAPLLPQVSLKHIIAQTVQI